MYVILCSHNAVYLGAQRLGFQHHGFVVFGTKSKTIVQLNEDDINLEDSVSEILQEEKYMYVEEKCDRMFLK